MKNKAIILSSMLASSMLFLGCNGDTNEKAVEKANTEVIQANSVAIIESNTTHNLAPQNTADFQMFYGNSKHSGLGSLSNVYTHTKDTNTSTSKHTTMGSRYPAMSTSLTYGANNTYSDMKVDEISYIADDNASAIDMATGTQRTFTDYNVSGSHTEVNYMGSKQYLIITKADGDSSLIAPGAGVSDAVPFTHKSLQGVTYQTFGGAVDGYIALYDPDHDYKTTNELQKCNLDMSTCTKITDIGSKTILSHGSPKTTYDITMLGDIAGTTKSIYISDGKIVELNKADGTTTELSTIVDGSASHTMKGSEIFYVKMMNIYKTTLDGKVTQLSSDGLSMGFSAFTDDMVIYGGDTYMYAVAKDGSNKNSSIQISKTTKLAGQKYPFDLGIGSQYLYTTYKVDPASGKHIFYACKLENKKKECREDAYWSAVSAKVNGTLNDSSTYLYEPYAYIRIDDPDNYGGGKVKAIDPQHPLEDGLTMGTSEENFNFQTFVNSKYDNNMVDSNGSIVLYAKNDIDFRGNAYMMNLNKANSLVALTNEEKPDINDLTVGGAHCHGRMCTVCHSFAGGKIYEYKMKYGKYGWNSAKGYTVKFAFEDGSKDVVALVRKGEGENFNVTLEDLKGKNFKASVVRSDDNASVVAETAGYSHKGLEFFNCNYCHGRAGQLLHDAPNIIRVPQ